MFGRQLPLLSTGIDFDMIYTCPDLQLQTTIETNQKAIKYLKFYLIIVKW